MNSRIQEFKKNQQSRAEVRIAAFLHSCILECLSAWLSNSYLQKAAGFSGVAGERCRLVGGRHQPRGRLSFRNAPCPAFLMRKRKLQLLLGHTEQKLELSLTH